MTSYSLSPVVAFEASERGALAGFESVCSCGLRLRSSLRTLLEQDRVEHAAYHERRAAHAASSLNDLSDADRDAHERAVAAAVIRRDDVAYVRTQLAEAIAARMILGESYDEATAAAFAYCDRRWPAVTAAVIAEAA